MYRQYRIRSWGTQYVNNLIILADIGADIFDMAKYFCYGKSFANTDIDTQILNHALNPLL